MASVRTVPIDHFRDAIGKSDARLETDGPCPGNIHDAPAITSRLTRVPDNLRFFIGMFADHLDQLADGYSGAAAQIDWLSIGMPQRQQHAAGDIVGVNDVADGGTVAPNAQWVFATQHTPNERGNHHGVIEIEVVIRAIDIRRTDNGDLFPAELDAIRLGLQLAHTFGPAGEAIILRREGSPNIILTEDLRGTIDADGAGEQETLHAALPRCLHQVGVQR